MFSERTKKWVLVAALTFPPVAMRAHDEVEVCRFNDLRREQSVQRRAEPDQPDVGISFSITDLCRPGDHEPFWISILILITFSSAFGAFISVTRDLWFCLLRTRTASSPRG